MFTNLAIENGGTTLWNMSEAWSTMVEKLVDFTSLFHSFPIKYCDFPSFFVNAYQAG
jgi:hypothetical protein